MRKSYLALLMFLFCSMGCTSTKAHPINGMPYDAQRKCWMPSTAFGTTTADRCTDILMHSIGPKGKLWRHNGCYPKTHKTTSEVPKEATAAPACTDQPKETP